MAKAKYTQPSSEQFAEEVASGKYDAASSRVNRGDDAQLSDDGFIATDDIYRNFADPIHQPLQGDGKIGKELESQFLTDDADNTKGATAEGESEVEKDEKDAPPPSSPSTPPTGGTSSGTSTGGAGGVTAPQGSPSSSA
jgi:hypothetical protein